MGIAAAWAAPALLAAMIVGQGPTAAAPDGYLVTLTMEDASGRATAEELLSFGSDRGVTFATLRNRAGDSAVTQVIVKPNGTIDASTRDPAITCYNVAMSILADGSTTRSSASSLAVVFQSYVVRVPLQLTTAEFSDGTHGIVAEGRAAVTPANGQAPLILLIDGGITSRQGILLSARVRQTTVVSSTGGALAQSTCVVTPVSIRTPSAEPAI